MRKRSIVLVLASILATTNAKESANEFGGTVGWGSPYGGIAVHYARNVDEIHGIGVGVGLSGAGTKYGIDYKLFFNSQESFNPYLGLALSHASGVSELNVTVNADTAVYKVKGGTQLTPRVGFRYKTGSLGLYVNAGYGICLSGGGVEYISGSDKKSIHDFAKMMSPGGLEVSASGTLFF